MQQSQEQQRIEYRGIRFSREALCGVQGGRTYSVIPHAEIRQVTLHHGSLSAHPLIQLLVGTALAACAIPVVIHLIHWINEGGTIMSEEALFLVFPAVGVILLFTALRRGFYLTIEKQRGRAKLAFDSGAKLPEVESMLATARAIVKYPVEVDSAIPR